MTDPGSKLFEPVQLGPNRLANRMVMAPMSRNRAAGESADALTAKYYAQRASAGLIVSEASPVSPYGRTSRNAPGIYSAAQVAGWRLVTQAVHAQGGRIFLQLWHSGRVSHPSVQPGGALPIAPSAVCPQGSFQTQQGPVLLARSARRVEEGPLEPVGGFACAPGIEIDLRQPARGAAL